MSGNNGVLVVAGDTKDAIQDLKLAFRSAESALPDEKGDPEAPEAAPAKKKQLFSQDRADTKQVLVSEEGMASATFTIGAGLPLDQEKALVNFLSANKEVFGWEPKDLVGIPRGIIEHHMRVCPNVHPVKQKVRRQLLPLEHALVFPLKRKG